VAELSYELTQKKRERSWKDPGEAQALQGYLEAQEK